MVRAALFYSEVCVVRWPSDPEVVYVPEPAVAEVEVWAIFSVTHPKKVPWMPGPGVGSGALACRGAFESYGGAWYKTVIVCRVCRHFTPFYANSAVLRYALNTCSAFRTFF